MITINGHKYVNEWDIEMHARDLAEWAHHGQEYKPGYVYKMHLAAVVGMLARNGYKEGHQTRIVAWLHDVLEDTDVPASLIHSRFGSNVAKAVSTLTHLPASTPYDVYLAHIIKVGGVALTVKQADLYANYSQSRSDQNDEYGSLLEADDPAFIVATRRREKYAKAIRDIRKAITPDLWIKGEWDR